MSLIKWLLGDNGPSSPAVSAVPPALGPTGVVTFHNPAMPSAADVVKVLDPGQLGAGAMAGKPHGSTAAPGIDDGKNAQPIISTGRQPRDLRGFRLAGRSGVPSGPIAPWDDADNTPTTVAAHELPNGTAIGSNAVPDPRRIDGANGQPAGYPEPAAESLRASAENMTNASALYETNSVQLDRPRAGAANPSQGRPSQTRRPLFTRPFDKLAADTLTGHRDVMGAPLASTPIAYGSDVPNAIPSPGGSFSARGMEPVTIQPNNPRMQPRPWDESLTTTPAAVDPGIVASQLSRGRGWRAGG